MNANRHSGGGVTINMPSQTYVLSLAPAGPDDDASGDLNITGTGLTVRNGDAGTTGSGGGIDNFGRLTLINSLVSGNSSGLGGGLFNEQDATLLVRHSIISDNRAVLKSGGGIENVGLLTIENSTVNANRALDADIGYHDWDRA